MKPLAAIELGSHTARLLVAEASERPVTLKALARERAYVRMADGFDSNGARCIGDGGFHRSEEVLKRFSRVVDRHGALLVQAVATGVVRSAMNRKEFLESLHRKTSIRVRAISGEKEACLTGIGVCHALGIQSAPFVIFDLGGGSTEIVFGLQGKAQLTSIPLGASLLTQAYLKSDPPDEAEIDALLAHVQSVLDRDVKHPPTPSAVAGTGGTVVSLAGLIHEIPMTRLKPETVNGLSATVHQLDVCLNRLRRLGTQARQIRLGLDKGRADVIVGGALMVRKLLDFLGAKKFLVSMSDLLEGILIDAVSCGQDRDNDHSTCERGFK